MKLGRDFGEQLRRARWTRGVNDLVPGELEFRREFAVGVVAFLLAGLRTGADALQSASGALRVPIAIAFMLEGAILLAALGGEVFRRNRLVVRRIAEVTA